MSGIIRPGKEPPATAEGIIDGLNAEIEMLGRAIATQPEAAKALKWRLCIRDYVAMTVPLVAINKRLREVLHVAHTTDCRQRAALIKARDALRPYLLDEYAVDAAEGEKRGQEALKAIDELLALTEPEKSNDDENS